MYELLNIKVLSMRGFDSKKEIKSTSDSQQQHAVPQGGQGK